MTLGVIDETQGTALGQDPETSTNLTAEPDEMREVSILVRCVGTRPLMMDPMSDPWSTLGPPKKQMIYTADTTPHMICEDKLYKDEKGNIGIPALNLFSALIYAGRYLKVGKTQISTTQTTQLPSFLQIEEEFLPFPLEEQLWEPDIRRGVSNNAAKKSAVCIVRPKFKKWSVTFTLKVMLGEGVTVEHIRQLVRLAGTKAGLCSFRPNCKGNFGMFELAEFEVME